MTARTWDEKFPKPEGPHGWVQWKGTQVCMDVHCVCGVHGHIDADFAYRVECKACGRIYEVDGYVRLVEQTAEERLGEQCKPIKFEESDLVDAQSGAPALKPGAWIHKLTEREVVEVKKRVDAVADQVRVATIHMLVWGPPDCSKCGLSGTECYCDNGTGVTSAALDDSLDPIRDIFRKQGAESVISKLDQALQAEYDLGPCGGHGDRQCTSFYEGLKSLIAALRSPP